MVGCGMVPLRDGEGGLTGMPHIGPTSPRAGSVDRTDIEIRLLVMSGSVLRPEVFTSRRSGKALQHGSGTCAELNPRMPNPKS